MSWRIHLLIILALPLMLWAGLTATDTKLVVPFFGRDYVLHFAIPREAERTVLPEIFGPADLERPLVVIDPGHGGRDPGASAGVGADAVREKDVVLALALALRDKLIEEGSVRVALTREDDEFIVLAERSEMARRLGADLFLSIHADSAGEMASVGGASVYTLSNQASSEAAARFAARENDADRLNGVTLDTGNQAVNTILVELSQRQTQEASNAFAQLILREGRGRVLFHPQARRSAALAVLRAPEIPSVLYESGFITNPEDAQRLTSEEGKAQFAQTMARAIAIYFARNPRN